MEKRHIVCDGRENGKGSEAEFNKILKNNTIQPKCSSMCNTISPVECQEMGYGSDMIDHDEICGSIDDRNKEVSILYFLTVLL